MLDFLRIVVQPGKKKDSLEIYPKFIIGKCTDLMIRGGDFYAIYDESTGLWSTDEDVVKQIIDKEINLYYKEHKDEFSSVPKRMYMWDSDTGTIDRWHKYCQRQQRDSYHALDEKLIFSNSEVKKEDYASKKLPYPLQEGSIDSYNRLMSVLYLPEERHKLEWAIGSIVSGDSKDVQKFVVLYGEPGSGKSTVLNIIQDLFQGYYCTFDAKAIGSANKEFALEPFRSNPLVAIQHDGDLSKIEDNTRLNSIASHELMNVNEKFAKQYTQRFNAFLFMGTNKPVKITDSKSGILRRLIDVMPSGNRLSRQLYSTLTSQIKFELGAIAWHCLQVYKDDPNYYDDYIPTRMMGASNDFYNFVLDSWDILNDPEGVSLTDAYTAYKAYCNDSNVTYPFSRRVFREELKTYFKEFIERDISENGRRVRSLYKGFITDKFEYKSKESKLERAKSLKFEDTVSIFDEEYSTSKAQYANDEEAPQYKWTNVKTTLGDLDTTKLHYVRVPENHIVIDFDIKDKNGEKSLKKNIEAASKWPETYGELSKSGKGIHLHYIYDGDVSKLSRIYSEGIEIKIFTGKSSLRRKLTYCNNKPIATINSGLPTKGEDKVVNFESVKSEKGLRTLIKKNLNKEIHPGTKPSVDFIAKILEDAYNSGLKYDVSDMRPAILAFAANSSHKPGYCLKIANEMKYRSEEPSKGKDDYKDNEYIFFDVEVFKNLFIIVWKPAGGDPVKMINPTPKQIGPLLNMRLIGFNCRRYDNHILYARYIGYSNEELYRLSQKIVNGDRNAFFGEAYNISYTDIYDFSSKKQSLKKFEIELGIHHQELGIPWDQEVPEELWDKVADYCINDVVATEAVFYARKEDFLAREILADICNGSVNDTTNQLSAKIIFGDDKHPQDKFVYTDLSTIFPGYKFDNGHSLYRGEDPKEGGYVYSEPGMYTNVALLDVQSMHPTSIEQLNLFGPYTKNFSDLKKARVLIKHGEFDKAGEMFDGKLKKWLSDSTIAKSLSFALKIVINAVYGLTSASFDNKFRDPRNIDNIVAKRGALFMINLKHEVQDRGFTVAHIKTDSIKIPNATPEIIQFVMDYGKQYGYIFEHEATYERMCLVNDAVYIAKYADGPHEFELPTGEKIFTEWTATGTQFQVPYVFKTLFSKNDIVFRDMCETKAVTTSLYLDMNEHLKEDEHDYVFIGKVGLFCPIKKGCGGGILLREKDGKYYAATGSKGYRWLESETVKVLGKENDIDRSYYDEMVDEAIASISEYGDFEWFAN